MSSDPRYPIGPYDPSTVATADGRQRAMEAIAALPARFLAAVQGLTETQLDTPYRDGGWTVRQLVHHVPDSHMNGYIRFKLALTEEMPIIKPYMEARWAELADVRTVPVETVLSVLDPLHQMWLGVLRSMHDADFERGFVHPEYGTTMTLTYALGLYAWHGRHHTAHITTLRDRMGW